jgi:hypothetical protein
MIIKKVPEEKYMKKIKFNKFNLMIKKKLIFQMKI